MKFRQLLWRACRLRCAFCGQGRLFRGWFAMHSHCSECHVSFEREPGFFLGSIYFNYGLTALIAAVAYPILLFTRSVPERPLLFGALAFTLLFPVWFFRYARSLWLGFDQYMDPREQYLTTPATTPATTAATTSSAPPATTPPPVTTPQTPAGARSDAALSAAERSEPSSARS